MKSQVGMIKYHLQDVLPVITKSIANKSSSVTGYITDSRCGNDRTVFLDLIKSINVRAMKMR